MWKRKRRKSIVFLKYLCLSCGLVFLFGNAMLIKDGLLEIYNGKSSTFEKDLSRMNLDLENPINDVLELPASALSQETKLRRLMDLGNVDTALKSNTRNSSHNKSIFMDSNELKLALSLTSDCSKVSFDEDNNSFIAAGWTKAVYRGTIKNRSVAIKTVHRKGFDASKCLNEYKKRGGSRDCYKIATDKILKETVLLEGLKHPNIIKVESHCIPTEELKVAPEADSKKVHLVTELGETVDLIRLLQMSWEDRLRIAYGLTKLVYFLSHSPYGPVILNDFRRQQFVLIKGEIKLSDMDDAGFEEPSCDKDTDCTHFFSASNYTLKTNCQENRCYKFNEKINIYNIGRHFTSFLLPYGCPQGLCAIVNNIVQEFTNVTTDSIELLRRLSQVVEMYSSGEYLNRSPNSPTAYREFLLQDLPGKHDYTCHFNVGPVCTVSVYDRLEAETLCDNDTHCAGFVLSSQTSWTGRILAHFKNGYSSPSYNSKTKLYVKPGFINRRT